MGRRPLLVIAGWFGAVVLATVVGLAAISVIGSGLTSSDTRPRTEAEVADLLAGASSVPPASVPPASVPPASVPPAPASSTTAPAAAGSSPRRTFPTAGGTVTARCDGALVQILSVSPAQGYAVHDRVAGEPGREAEAEFRGTTDDHDRVKATVRCVSGVPTLTLSVRNGD